MTEESELTLSQDENHIIAERRAKLAELRKQTNPFPNYFRRDSFAMSLQDTYCNQTKEDLDLLKERWKHSTPNTARFFHQGGA